ncbi:inositol monophosphatase family protein [Streptomyces flavidovirens]|uniref:inositol-phosphate phosphatase n=1 Tax=Streptomyces flavidovirens TaxID=67298 RepID=A0ABW6RMH4_9ACTN
MDPDELLTVARTAAQAGARTAMAWRERANRLLIEEKEGPDDLVSQADRDTERAIRMVLAQHRPQDGVLGEEDGATAGRADVRWIVDPIDGTTNYLYGRPDWAVSVAAAEVAGGRLLAGVVIEPALDPLTWVRSPARAVATGRADALWAPGLQSWDCAAGALLVLQAGGTVGDLVAPSPGTWPASGDVLAAPPPMWTQLRALLADVYPPLAMVGVRHREG